MQIDELRDYLNTHWQTLRSDLLSGTYRPQAVRKVEIPKASGGKRMLGIPTVIDRVIQQSISQWLGIKYEGDFHDNSYGFRPDRNAHQAVRKAQEYLITGYTWIVELDLEKFFDKVNHDKLMHLLSKKITDRRVLALIGKYLRCGIMDQGLEQKRTKGTPQGSPLSPLLSNIILHELDTELSSRGHRFVRYADDCSIYTRSNKSATRIMHNISRYIETTLKLIVNREKSKVSRPTQSSLLGFSFFKTRGQWHIRISAKSIERIREKLRQHTRRNSPTPMHERLDKLRQITQGWVNYFRISRNKKVMIGLDQLIRRRLRVLLWKQWKTIGNRIRNLMKLGAKRWLACQHANTRKSYTRTGTSAILETTLTNSYFTKLGYEGFADYYYWRTTHQTTLF
jgi:group II intron reverse transcriptase/maturase